MTSSCTLILNGKVGVYTGVDGYRTELGAWMTIAPETLHISDGLFFPDFTAIVESEYIHLLMINIHSLEACKIIALEKRKSEMGINSDAIGGRHSLGEKRRVEASLNLLKGVEKIPNSSQEKIFSHSDKARKSTTLISNRYSDFGSFQPMSGDYAEYFYMFHVF
jgi:hypothetical protein